MATRIITINMNNVLKSKQIIFYYLPSLGFCFLYTKEQYTKPHYGHL